MVVRVSADGVEGTVDEPLSVERLGGDPFVVRLVGDLDVGTAGLFADTMERVRAEHQVDVVLDVQDLSFVDSQGISALLMARREGNRFLLRRPRDSFRKLIDVTGLGDVLPIERSMPPTAP